MTISTLPTAPSRNDPPATFIARADAMIAALSTLVTELNATLPTIQAAEAGLPISIPLTFSTTTTDADPGAGTIRFNNATQNATTQLYVDLTSAASGNPDITALLDWMDDSTSTSSKGVIKIYETGTTSNYVFFKLSSWTTATGYRKLTVVVLAASAANPFGNSDALTFQFWPMGDAGSVAGGITLTDANIVGIKNATFNAEYANTTPTTGAATLNWTLGNNQSWAEPTGIITFTMTAPPGPAHLMLKIKSDGSSTAYTPTFSPTPKWLGATWAPAANKNAILSFWYDGTSYWAQGVNEV